MNDTQQARTLTDAGEMLVERSLQLLSEEIELAGRFFPHGVNSIRVRLSVANVGEVELEVEGPASAALVASRTADLESLAAPAITRIDPDQWTRGQAGELRIIGTGFTKPIRVRIPAVTTRAPRWNPANPNEILLDIEVDDYGGGSARDVEIYFESKQTAKKDQIFKVADAAAP